MKMGTRIRLIRRISADFFWLSCRTQCSGNFKSSPNINVVIFFFIVNLLIFNEKTFAQKGFSIEPSVHFGRIAKHTPKLLFQVPPLSIGTEIHLSWQTYGKKVWHEWQGYPPVGISLVHYNLGDAEVFGNAFAVYPSIDFRILKKIKPFKTYIQWGWGLAYLTRHYDQFTNPTNNAVSSALNNITDFKFKFEKQVSPHFTALAAFSFTHFSNGSARLPNYGINIPALNVGLKWTPNPIFETQHSKYNTQNSNYTEGYIHRDSSSKSDKKWGINAFAGLGLSASTEPRGPQYPIYSTIVSVVHPLNKVNNLSLGIQFEQNRVVSEFGLASGEFATKAEANKAGNRWGAFVGEEFLYGRVAIIVQSGFYLHHYIRMENIWFNRLGVRLCSPKIGRTDIQGHIGIYMKAHKISAEQFAVLGGLSF
jgi:Lipid A 3-O-deacylase (PagL)